MNQLFQPPQANTLLPGIQEMLRINREAHLAPTKMAASMRGQVFSPSAAPQQRSSGADILKAIGGSIEDFVKIRDEARAKKAKADLVERAQGLGADASPEDLRNIGMEFGALGMKDMANQHYQMAGQRTDTIAQQDTLAKQMEVAQSALDSAFPDGHDNRTRALRRLARSPEAFYEYLDSYEKKQQAKWTTLTDEQEAAKGLDVAGTYQIGPQGKINTIYRPEKAVKDEWIDMFNAKNTKEVKRFKVGSPGYLAAVDAGWVSGKPDKETLIALHDPENHKRYRSNIVEGSPKHHDLVNKGWVPGLPPKPQAPGSIVNLKMPDGSIRGFYANSPEAGEALKSGAIRHQRDDPMAVMMATLLGGSPILDSGKGLPQTRPANIPTPGQTPPTGQATLPVPQTKPRPEDGPRPAFNNNSASVPPANANPKLQGGGDKWANSVTDKLAKGVDPTAIANLLKQKGQDPNRFPDLVRALNGKAGGLAVQ